MDNTNDKNEIRTIIIGNYTIYTYGMDYIKRIKNLYGFIYITTNMINGKKYVGQRKMDKNSKWKSYLGSGEALKKAINKYGKENFHREIIDIAFDKNELNILEKYYTILFDTVNDDNWYNMCYGGGTYILTEEQRKEMSERMKSEANPMLGRKHTEEELKFLRQRFSGKNNPMHGKSGVNSPNHRSKSKYVVKINQYTLDNKFIKMFPSIVEASESLNISSDNIQACAKGMTSYCGGYKWYYAHDPHQPDKTKIIPNDRYKDIPVHIYKFFNHRSKEIKFGIIIDYKNKRYTFCETNNDILNKGIRSSQTRIYEFLNEVKLLKFTEIDIDKMLKLIDNEDV
jgi:group I intron endonuclease